MIGPEGMIGNSRIEGGGAIHKRNLIDSRRGEEDAGIAR